MGIISSLFSAFMDGYHKSLPQTPQKPEPELKYTAPKPDDQRKLDDAPSHFERRLRRARTEPLKIVGRQYVGAQWFSADVYNDESGKTYRVTSQACTCEDFSKHQQPCKHMIYLSLQMGDYKRYERSIPSYMTDINAEGEFIPLYWRYYSGPPTGIGYTNLYLYEVSGRLYGISEKTGRPTNRKKVIIVTAISEEDAEAAAEMQKVVPPYESIRLIDQCPSINQYAYLRGVGIPAPYFLNQEDIGALLTRYQTKNNNICPACLFQIATKRRIMVSYFDTPQAVASAIWYHAIVEEKHALFCYAVYCKEKQVLLGNTSPLFTSEPFISFAPTEKQSKYIQTINKDYPGRTLTSLSSRSQAYAAAVWHIKRNAPWLL